MDIPAHRAAAVVPTPAQTFERRDGDQLVAITGETAPADASLATPPLADETDAHGAEPDGDPLALSPTAKRRRLASETPIVTAPIVTAPLAD
ncbi:hypothetical protein [Azospirillum doebereinerae]|uniref:Uncharacterized protein n=1 Tax=Azospirillum doebereinerae TaxID=92933 RepID=A0A3S0WX81_9PROT|nr:hypothetical protein [Azospirillum doebereinerae]RUQ67458.1 hypothetical protein EJ913_19745 [Azospirillum doebereinerae]